MTVNSNSIGLSISDKLPSPGGCDLNEVTLSNKTKERTHKI